MAARLIEDFLGHYFAGRIDRPQPSRWCVAQFHPKDRASKQENRLTTRGAHHVATSSRVGGLCTAGMAGQGSPPRKPPDGG